MTNCSIDKGKDGEYLVKVEGEVLARVNAGSNHSYLKAHMNIMYAVDVMKLRVEEADNLLTTLYNTMKSQELRNFNNFLVSVKKLGDKGFANLAQSFMRDRI